MALTEVFFDLSLGSGGDGTASDPYGNLSSMRWANNLRLRFRRGVVHKLLTPYFGGITVPASVTGGIEITDFGDSENRAVLDGSREFKTWTRYSGNVWYAAGAGATAGVVRQDGVALRWVHGKGGAGTFVPQMTAGSYALDHSDGVYVWLRDDANPNDSGVQVEVATTPLGIWVGGRPTTLFDLQVTNLRLTGFSRQGGNVENVTNAQFVNNVVQYTGGYWDPKGNYYLGGGLQCGGGSRSILFERNVCTDVYDSPLSPQVYRPNTTIDNVTIRRNVLGNYALAGVEIAIWSENCSISNVTVEDNHIFGGGRGFSGTGDNVNNTEGVIINGLSKFSGIRVEGNLIDGIDHSGVEIRGANSTGIQILRNRISGCRYGVRNFTGTAIGTRVVASFNEISDCSEYGILHDQRLGTIACEYRKNTLVNNGLANISLQKVNTTIPVVQDNNCVGSEYGIRKDGNLAVPVKYNNAFGASRTNYAGVIADGTNRSVAPGFPLDSSGDYQLTTTSPLKGAGSGNSLGADLIGKPYVTDDIGCHAIVSATVNVARRADLEALTS